MRWIKPTLLIFLVVLFTLAGSPLSAQYDREIARLGVPNTLVWRPDGQLAAESVVNGVQFYDAQLRKIALLPLEYYPADLPQNLSWSPDGRLLVVTATDRIQRENQIHWRMLWSVSDDGRTFENHFSYADELFPAPIQWSPDSRRVAFQSRIYDAYTGQLSLLHRYARSRYDSATGQFILMEREYEAFGGIYWSPDGAVFAAASVAIEGSSRANYAIFDAQTGDLCVELLESDVSLYDLEFFWSPDGTKLADYLGRVWDTRTGVRISAGLANDIDYSWPGSGRTSVEVIWAGDNQSLFLLSNNLLPLSPPSTLFKVDAISGQLAYKRSFWHELGQMSWLADALRLESRDGQSVMLNPATGQVISAARTTDSFPVSRLAWSADSSRLVAVTSGPLNPLMQLWDMTPLQSGDAAQLLWTANDDWFAYEETAAAYPPDYARVMWDESGESLVTITNNIAIIREYHAVQRWDAATGALLETPYLADALPDLPMAEPSPDGRFFAQVNNNAQLDGAQDGYPLTIVDARTSEKLFTFQTHAPDIIRWRPDSQRLAAVSFFGGLVEVWDITPEGAHLASTFNTSARSAEWSPDGHWLAAGGQVIDPDTGAVVAESKLDTSRYLASVWSPDSRILALYQDGTLLFWDWEANHILESYMLGRDVFVSDIGWSPDGAWLAFIISGDNTIHIWDVADIFKPNSN